ncbi:metallophosphoesterase [Pedobacter frigoris]|uniref:Redoxin domain-containing protein n=1 Tax=Pedobacter frigoris TaxID=2571272 RepID=A0A4U1CSB4_9SPHI|nr:metallophosphoesterase [Pedobacter frigoris]TKC08618.1 redoxin domain-containing protein [Pedobacter frigoris]
MRTSYRLLGVLILLVCFYHTLSAQKKSNLNGSAIVVEFHLPADYKKDSMKVDTGSFIKFVHVISYRPIDKEIKNGYVKFRFPGHGPLYINLSEVLGKSYNYTLFEPGDSVQIRYDKKGTRFTGKGAEKFRLLEEVKINMSKLSLPANPKLSVIASLKDYQEWHLYLNRKLLLIDSLFEDYKKLISPFIYAYLKVTEIADVEYQRLHKFGLLVNKASVLGLSGEKLGQIFDSTLNSGSTSWVHTYSGKALNSYYFYDFIRRSVERKYNFDYAHDSLKNASRKTAYWNFAKKIYKGNVLQSVQVFLLTEGGLKTHTLKDGSTPEIEYLLNEFYKLPGYPEYKAYVRDYEQMIRAWVIHVGGNSPDFALQDGNGQSYGKKDFEGKLVLLNFFDDSKECSRMKVALRKVSRVFQQDSNVIFLNISTEKNKTVWQNSLSGVNTPVKNLIELYTNGQGKMHPVLNYYNIRDYPKFNFKAFPAVFMLNNKGEFLYNGEFGRAHGGALRRHANRLFPDPRKDNGQALIGDIYEQLALMQDGPYVFHGKEGITAYSMNSSTVTELKYPAKRGIGITIGTDDLRKNFPVQLKTKLTLEPSVTATRPEKLFVLSDIEGEFEAFRKLLQANKIIDSDFNWTFGNGHLVFAGDMFDRGLQVTECLWLVYMLEKKAKAAGGYVHFILGNHEIMNLQGDHRYVEDKYKNNAALMCKTLMQLYNEDSELGRWLRTKNIVEKIGDLLFAHGGISAELNNQPLSVEQINLIARPFYADSAVAKNADTKVNLLYSSTTSPFWYRLYYATNRFSKSNNKWIYKAKEAQVDSTLQKFNVRHIVTGHTIVADTISVHYGGKVINTDTKHRDGKSEALLIEGDSFYRVNAEGKRVLLFRDEEK